MLLPVGKELQIVALVGIEPETSSIDVNRYTKASPHRVANVSYQITHKVNKMMMTT